MRKAVGLSTLVMPDAPLLERETFTCNHCDCIRPVTVWNGSTRQENSNVFWCDSCDARVCGPCVNEKRDHSCVVWERKMERMENRVRFLDALSKL